MKCRINVKSNSAESGTDYQEAPYVIPQLHQRDVVPQRQAGLEVSTAMV